MKQQLEQNPTNPQESDHSLPDSFIQFLSSTHQIIISFSTSVIPYPTKSFLFFPGRPCCDKAQQNRRQKTKGRRKIKYCCTIPFIIFARFRLHLNRLNKLNKIIYPKLIFSKCLKLLIKYPIKCLKTWFSLKHRSQVCYLLNGTKLSRRSKLNAAEFQSNN